MRRATPAGTWDGAPALTANLPDAATDARRYDFTERVARRLSGVAVTTGQPITVADLAVGNLVFAPDRNATGNADASFSFQVQDDGGMVNGGADLDPTPNTMTIDVRPPTAPVNSGSMAQRVAVTSLGSPGPMPWSSAARTACGPQPILPRDRCVVSAKKRRWPRRSRSGRKMASRAVGLK